MLTPLRTLHSLTPTFIHTNSHPISFVHTKGSHCQWAHGEDDLQGEAGEKAKANKETDRQWKLNQEQEEYANSMTRAYKDEREVVDMVAKGLQVGDYLMILKRIFL